MSAEKPPLLGQTPSQTVGPFFAYGLTPVQYGYAFTAVMDSTVAEASAAGTHIRIEGCVFDGKGEVITDAMIEIWQADSEGRYVRERGANSGFVGFGRCGTGTDAEGKFWFTTIKPGVIAAGQAPHINVTVMMRGLLLHAFTRLYFEDETEANAADEVLQTVPADRRATLMAKRVSDGLYRFDIHMQGDQETVFFDL
ncbi:MAG: protocatechuate 3,4-dioxygenase subunit alpha [Beijerinckiaceae bacterium]